MPIQFRCQTCRKLLSVARRKSGQDTECPVCGSKTRVPGDIPDGPPSGSTATHPEMVAAPYTGKAVPAPYAEKAVPAPYAEKAVPAPYAEKAVPASGADVMPSPAAPRPDPSGTSTPAIGTPSAAKPSAMKPKRIPGSSGILEIDPDRLFGKSHSKNTGSSPSLEKPAKELSDYFEAIDRAQEMEDSGSQAVEVPEPFLRKPSSWKLRFFAAVIFAVLASALVVGFLLIRGW
jgi:DNA-directed RNA polymerase subunit RPC12/RpoP